MIVYFDSSAFVKLLFDETDSAIADELWDGCELAVSSRLAYPEVRAALASAARNHRLSESRLNAAERDWEGFWAATLLIELGADVALQAGGLARTHGLGGADAVHLASAMAIGADGLTFASWDQRLGAGAASAGLAVVPNR